MILSNLTSNVLSAFAEINQNLVIDSGSTFSTWSMPAKDVFAQYSNDLEQYPHDVSIFNLKEFISAYNSIPGASINIEADHVTIISDTKNMSVEYWYADRSVLSFPTKVPKFPPGEIVFELDYQQISQLTKMAKILKVNDLTFKCGENGIEAKVYNPGVNDSFKITISPTPQSSNCEANLKVSLLDKILITKSFNYVVSLSSVNAAIFSAKFPDDIKASLMFAIALEPSSKFGV